MKVWIFLMILYLYRKKVVWIVVFDCGLRWVEVLISVGFDDIGCDIGIFGLDGGKMGILLGFGDFGLSAWKLSLYVDEPAYRLPEKQNTCSSFCYPRPWSVGIFPFYRNRTYVLFWIRTIWADFCINIIIQ